MPEGAATGLSEYAVAIGRLPGRRCARRASAGLVAEADVGEDAAEPVGERPGRLSEEAERDGDEDESDEHGVEEDGDAEDDAHFFGWEWPGEGEGEEDGDHDGGGGEDDAAGVGESADGGVFRVAGSVPVLFGGGEQEDGVVHRDREDHGEEEDGAPGVDEALRLEAEQAGAVAVLEDQAGDSEGGADREQVGEDADGGDHGGLQCDQEQEEAEAEDDADHERGLGRECLFEVVVLGGCAADEHSGGERRAEPVDRAADGLAGRVLLRDGLDQRELPVAGGLDAGGRGRCRSRVASTVAAAAALPLGPTIWSCPGAPGPKACWTSV